MLNKNIFPKDSNIYKYYQKISKGEIKVGKKINMLYDFLFHLMKTENVYYNIKTATLPITFIELLCKHDKGKWANTNIKLELWQKAIIEMSYGILEKGTDKRWFKKILLVVGRKNGKSLLASGLSLYSLMADGVNGAEVYMIATQKEQAKIVFDTCRKMISQSGELSSRLRNNKFEVEYDKTLSKMRPLATEGSAKNSLDGLNPSMVVLDEIHAYANEKKINEMASGMGSRREPLMWMITTAGHVREGAFDSQMDASNAILSKTASLDVRVLPIIYQLDSAESFDDEKEWIKANPNLGVSKTKKYLREELASAKLSPNKKNEFLTKHCNIATSSKEAFFDLDDLNANSHLKFKMTSFKEMALRKKENYPCYVGVDLSHVGDLTGVTFILKKPDSNELFVNATAFIPDEQFLKKQKTDKHNLYDIWRDEGWVITHPGNSIDQKVIVEFIIKMEKDYNLNIWKIGIDPWSSKTIEKLFIEEGFGERLKIVSQNSKTLNLPMEKILSEVKDKRFNFNNNKTLKWNMVNVITKTDFHGKIMPAKEKKEQRIDLFSSTLIAYACLLEEDKIYTDWIQYFKEEENKNV